MNKTIKIGNMEIEITSERRQRIVSAMIETQSKLEKELGYSEDLQNKDMIEFYNGHIAKLTEMLS